MSVDESSVGNDVVAGSERGQARMRLRQEAVSEIMGLENHHKSCVRAHLWERLCFFLCLCLLLLLWRAMVFLLLLSPRSALGSVPVQQGASPSRLGGHVVSTRHYPHPPLPVAAESGFEIQLTAVRVRRTHILQHSKGKGIYCVTMAGPPLVSSSNVNMPEEDKTKEQPSPKRRRKSIDDSNKEDTEQAPSPAGRRAPTQDDDGELIQSAQGRLHGAVVGGDETALCWFSSSALTLTSSVRWTYCRLQTKGCARASFEFLLSERARDGSATETEIEMRRGLHREVVHVAVAYLCWVSANSRNLIGKPHNMQHR